ncbi:hypothetical protein JEQ12_005892 [Ovis aries]|uniref:Uncharacterized protein n=1 Tax=Ovis aries TaxID=9940 RepID=A0A835ZYW8_SHEEP|nr:hypothetical protein JEQ12_005892 [Ovis aries]
MTLMCVDGPVNLSNMAVDSDFELSILSYYLPPACKSVQHSAWHIGAESRPAIDIPTTAHLQLGQVIDETLTRGTHCDGPLLVCSASSTRDEGQSTGEAEPQDGRSPALQEMDSTACPPRVLTLDTKDK